MGKKMFLRLNVFPVTIGGNDYMLSTNEDITERKKVEEALRESEERFRFTLRNSPVNVAYQDKDLVYTWAFNQKSFRPDEIIGKTDADLFGPEDAEWIIQIKKSVLKTGKEAHVERWLTSNGQRFYLSLHLEPVIDFSGQITGISIATVDLTERKLVELTLEESEKKYRELVKYAPSAIFEIDFRTRKLNTINDAMVVMSGYSRDELLSMDLLNILDEESKKIFRKRIELFLNGEKTPDQVEYKILTREGQIRHAILNMKFNLDENGRPFGAMVVGHDITDRRNAEEELKLTLESIGDGFFACDAEWKFVYINSHAEKILGLDRTKTIGKSHWEVFSTYSGY